MQIFSMDTGHVLGKQISLLSGLPLDTPEERNFEDGEHKLRPLVSVRNEDVYVIHSLYADAGQTVNDKLCKLLFFIATLKDAGASAVTAVLPYLCYTRKDRRTKSRDPVTTRYVATLFEAMGVDRIVTVDVHNLQAFQNSFRCNTEHLEAHVLFVNHFRDVLPSNEDVVVMSPDIGGIKRAETFRSRLSAGWRRNVGFAFMEKVRSQGTVSGETMVGQVKGKTVIILDDLISTGTTMARAAKACNKKGAAAVYAVATHGAFLQKADEVFRDVAVTGIVVTNTIPEQRVHDAVVKEKLVVLDIAPLLAETIRRLHTGGSLVSLMEID